MSRIKYTLIAFCMLFVIDLFATNESPLYDYFYGKLSKTIYLKDIKMGKEGHITFNLNTKNEVINLGSNIDKKNKARQLIYEAFTNIPTHLINLEHIGIKYKYSIVILKKDDNGKIVINKNMRIAYAKPPTITNCYKSNSYLEIAKCLDTNLTRCAFKIKILHIMCY